MGEFKALPDTEPIREVIKAAFDADLDIEGSWGYDKTHPTRILSLPSNATLSQVQHMLASMRAYLEMHLTLPKEERYGSINLNEISREEYTENARTLHKVVYEINAMKERDYNRFIDEYKGGYGKEDFDLEAHFRARKEATLSREVVYWFEVV